MVRVYPPVDGKPQNGNVSPSIVEFVAGFTAGVVATLAVHPFDVLKTRLQLELGKSQWGNSFRILRDIVRNEGSYSALYRGLMPNMIGNSVSWALYFWWYGSAKEMLRRRRGPGGQLTSIDYFLASGSSGVATAIFTNPIWVLKTRMLSSGRNAPGAYPTMAHGVSDILRNEGVRGFWRGLIPSLFGISHGAVQFAVYEQLKRQRRTQRSDKALTNLDYLLTAGSAKIFAGSVTYPYQVLRVRLQSYEADRTYRGVGDAIVQIWKHEGVRGYYKGLLPNVFRVLPSTCVTFLVYENTKFYFPRLYDTQMGYEAEE